jgi:hypothetical protein
VRLALLPDDRDDFINNLDRRRIEYLFSKLRPLLTQFTASKPRTIATGSDFLSLAV